MIFNRFSTSAGILAFAALLAAPVLAQESRSFTDDLDRTVEIPVDPQRIVALHDIDITVPLLEMGVIPVGSHGRALEGGSPEISGAYFLTGIDFGNSQIANLGHQPADIEAVAAAAPDLIITTPWQTLPVEQLEQIAPTVSLDTNIHGKFGVYERLAEITGNQAQLIAMEARYAEQIAEIRRLIDTENITVNVFRGSGDGGINQWGRFGTIGRVLVDAGFDFPDTVPTEPKAGPLNGEALQDADADYIFVPFFAPRETPADAIASLEAVSPNFCDFLEACRNNRLIVLPNREITAGTYYGLGVTASLILSHMSGRNLTATAE